MKFLEKYATLKGIIYFMILVSIAALGLQVDNYASYISTLAVLIGLDFAKEEIIKGLKK